MKASELFIKSEFETVLKASELFVKSARPARLCDLVRLLLGVAGLPVIDLRTIQTGVNTVKFICVADERVRKILSDKTIDQVFAERFRLTVSDIYERFSEVTLNEILK